MRRAVRTIAAAILACLGTLPGNAADEPLGRLFFTPQRRVALERTRQAGARESAVSGATLRLDGIVAPAGGKATVWINQRPLRADGGGNGVRTDSTLRATLTTDDAAPVALRVGESVERAARLKTDVLPAATLR